MSAELPINPETPIKEPESAKADVLGAAQTPQIAPKRKPGRPPGIKTPLKTKQIYNVEELATAAADAYVAGNGRGLKTSPLLQPASEDDRLHIQRITGETVEVFNEHMASRLRVIAEKASLRIEEKLDQDQFKSGELGFILSVAHDKRLSLDGSRALQSASVNIQVNNYGSSPKTALLSELDGLGSVKQVSPVPSQAVG